MAFTTSGRVVQQNQVVYGQVDFFQSDGFTRITGLTASTVGFGIFFGNAVQPWILVNGLTTLDATIASGQVYFNEIPGSPGYYNVRWRPSGLGYWRLVFTYTTGQQIVAQDFDVIASPPPVPTGLSASFIRPVCE